MISKKATEEDLRIMFSPFGTIEELTILRDSDGKSRGLLHMLLETFFARRLNKFFKNNKEDLITSWLKLS